MTAAASKTAVKPQAVAVKVAKKDLSIATLATLCFGFGNPGLEVSLGLARVSVAQRSQRFQHGMFAVGRKGQDDQPLRSEEIGMIADLKTR